MTGNMIAVPVLMGLAVLGTSIWVFVDAHKNNRSIMWGVGAILFFVVVFPVYLGKHRQTISAGIALLMWTVWVIVLIQWIATCAQAIRYI